MKSYKIILIIFFVTLFSCEEVVELDLNTAEPKLVIDASVDLLLDGTSIAMVKLTTTTGYYDDEIPFVTEAEVVIIDENGKIYPFNHEGEGIYVGELIPQENLEYTLEILYESEIYTATTTLQNTVPIDYIEQIEDGGFSGDATQLKVFFTDPASEENYYFLESTTEIGQSYDAISDDFFNGNTISYSFTNDEFSAGDEVVFSLYGTSRQNYNYLFTLLQQTGGSGGPFGTQPATVRGNITNQTNPENFPFGYFRISEVSEVIYYIQ